MNLVERLRSWRPTPLPKGREFERPGDVKSRATLEGAGPRPRPTGIRPLAGRAQGPAPSNLELVRCPRCEKHVPVEPLICERCGFPFICDTTPLDSARVKRRSVAWRTLLAIGGLLFWLTNAVFVAAGSEA